MDIETSVLKEATPAAAAPPAAPAAAVTAEYEKKEGPACICIGSNNSRITARESPTGGGLKRTTHYSRNALLKFAFALYFLGR